MLRIVPDGCESRTALAAMLVLVLRPGGAGRAADPRGAGEEPLPAQPDDSPGGHGRVSRQLRVLPRDGRTRRARPRPDWHLRVGSHRGVALSARAGRRPRHRDAAGRRLPPGTGYLEGADVSPDVERASACQADAAMPRTASGSSGRSAAAATWSTDAAACSVPTCRESASRGRPPRSRAKSAAPSKISARVRAGDGDDSRRPHRPRHAKER